MGYALLAIISLASLSMFKVYVVKGNSMEPTYYDHNVLIGKKNYSMIENGDVIVAKVNDVRYIKRIWGTPNDEILCTGGKIYINSQLIKDYECYSDTSIVLSEDEFFLLGDNGIVSEDSRNFGPVKKKQIEAKIIGE